MITIQSNRNNYCCITIFITNKCNLFCEYCKDNCLNNIPDTTKPQIKLKLLCNLIDQIHKPTIIKLSGGEPLLFPYYKELVKVLLSNQNIVQIEVYTNCTKKLDIVDKRIFYHVSLHLNYYNLIENFEKNNSPSIYPITQINILINFNQKVTADLINVLEFCGKNKIYCFPQLILRPDPKSCVYNPDHYTNLKSGYCNNIYNEFKKYYNNVYDDTFELSISMKKCTFLDILNLYTHNIHKKIISACNSFTVNEDMSIEVMGGGDTQITINNLPNAETYFFRGDVKNIYCTRSLMYSKIVII